MLRLLGGSFLIFYLKQHIDTSSNNRQVRKHPLVGRVDEEALDRN